MLIRLSSLAARSFSTLAIGGAAGTALSFLRNVTIARIIGVEAFGVAAAIALAATFIENSGDLGLDRYLLRYSGQALELSRGTAQSVKLIQGLLGAFVLVIAAPLVCLLYTSDAADE